MEKVMKGVVVVAAVLVVVLLIGLWATQSMQPGRDQPSADPAVAMQDSETSDSTGDRNLEPTLVSAIPELVREDGYVGAESCAECHADQHQSWHASYHRTMTQVVDTDSAPEVIKDTTVLVEGETYTFQQADEEFFVQIGDASPRRIVMMTGSHHMHVFWLESGIENTPDQLPIVYLIDSKRWIPRRSAFLRPAHMDGSELGRWNSSCSRCHSTHPRERRNGTAMDWDTRVVDFGIACEACHGPGEGHVRLHQSKAPVNDSELRDQIIDPMKLPASSRSDMCGRCHSINFVDLRVVSKEDFNANGLSFQPGDVLDDTQPIKLIRASGAHVASIEFQQWASIPGMRPSGNFWPDGHIRVSGRDYSAMIESPCFQRGDMTCLSCHTMHQNDLTLQEEWKDDQLKPNSHTDHACLQCHQEYQDLGSAHTHHPIDSSGSRCMNCHMPHTVYGLLKSIRSHSISSPSVLSTVQTTRPNACSLCHLDQTLEETSDYLAKWYGQEKPQLTPDEKETAFAVNLLLKGDAAQRVLIYSAMEHADAREVSGTDWMPPYLLLGMTDSYDAIRLISQRAYQSLPNAELLSYDFLLEESARLEVVSQEFKRLRSEVKLKPDRALLIDESGTIDVERYNRMLSERNNREVYLQE